LTLCVLSWATPCPVPGPLHKMQPHPILDPSRLSKHWQASSRIGQSIDPGATCEQAPTLREPLALHTTSKTPGDFDVGPGIRKGTANPGKSHSQEKEGRELREETGGGSSAASLLPHTRNLHTTSNSYTVLRRHLGTNLTFRTPRPPKQGEGGEQQQECMTGTRCACRREVPRSACACAVLRCAVPCHAWLPCLCKQARNVEFRKEIRKPVRLS
jgi:hypothetical protein